MVITENESKRFSLSQPSSTTSVPASSFSLFRAGSSLLLMSPFPLQIRFSMSPGRPRMGQAYAEGHISWNSDLLFWATMQGFSRNLHRSSARAETWRYALWEWFQHIDTILLGFLHRSTAWRGSFLPPCSPDLPLALLVVWPPVGYCMVIASCDRRSQLDKWAC